jgi:hypothetical protein
MTKSHIFTVVRYAQAHSTTIPKVQPNAHHARKGATSAQEEPKMIVKHAPMDMI